MIEHLRRLFNNSTSHVDAPDVALIPYTESVSEDTQPLHCTDEQKQMLTALVKSAVAVFPNAYALTGTYTLKFSPEIIRKISDGTYTIMKSTEGGLRAIAVDAQGKIVGQGTLVAATGLPLPTAAITVWQLLAVATAQHYLPDIQRHLIAMESGIQEIRLWLEANDRAVIVTSLKYLHELFVEGDNLDRYCEKRGQWSSHVERIYLDVDRVLESYRVKISTQTNRFQAINPHDWFGAERVQREFTNEINNLESLAKTFLSALDVKMLAIERLTKLEGCTAIQRHRLETISDDVAFLDTCVRSAVFTALKKASSMGGIVDPWGRDAAQQGMICRNASQAEERIKQRIRDTNQVKELTKTQLERYELLSKEGIALIVTLTENGQVTEIYESSKAIAPIKQ